MISVEHSRIAKLSSEVPESDHIACAHPGWKPNGRPALCITLTVMLSAENGDLSGA